MLQNALSKARFSSRNVSRNSLIPIAHHWSSTLRISSSGSRSVSKTSSSAPYPTSRHRGTTADTLSYGDDTVYALSTAPGRAGIAIVRISGPSCLEARYYHPLSWISLIKYRYTKACALPSHFQNCDTRPFELCTIPL